MIIMLKLLLSNDKLVYQTRTDASSYIELPKYWS